MKRMTILFALLLTPFCVSALDLDLGLQLGLRTTSGDIKDVYGNGTVFYPSLRLGVLKGLGIGLGYEAGYKKEGKIGLYDEDSTLKVGGVELFAAYEFRAGKLLPYARIGVGSYKYSQKVDSQFAQSVDKSKVAFSLGAGLKVLIDKFFVCAELKYTPLKVKPIDQEVDLGGVRLAAGVGYRFDL